MTGPFLVLLALLLVASADARAQSNVLPALAPCQGAGEALPDLEKRKQRLEQEVAEAQKKLSAAKDAPKDDARALALLKAVRTGQESLLDVALRIECARAKAEQQPGEVLIKRSAAKAQKELVEITAYYATTRNETPSREPLKVYGSDHAPNLHFGKTVVTIPFTHVGGNLELPKYWKLERQADPKKHFVLKSVTPMSQDDARREMLERLENAGRRAILLFVHGYYMGFPEAAMRTAQLAHDLQFPGVPFFFSWPSAAQFLSYWQDEEAAELSQGLFEKLLDDLSLLPTTDIYIIAHSMGNRIVSHALRERVEAGKPTRMIREVLLAAPDINAELFRRVIAPKIATMQGTRTTIYASSSDLALRASKIVHGFRRLGETTGGVFTYQGIDTIDASVAAQVARSYGHSYLMDSNPVLKDVRALIREKRAAKERGLSAVGQAPNIFYRLSQ
jgi:esterase/lipase superfamily enzyme